MQIAKDGTITVLEGNGRTDSIRAKLRLTTFSQPQRLVMIPLSTLLKQRTARSQPSFGGYLTQS